MIHFRDKQDLIDYVEKRCARRAIVRAISDGDVEFLGGFSRFAPRYEDGWILRITSRHDRVWHVAILADRSNTITLVNKVPWDKWAGGHSTHELMNGDNPDDYKRRKLNSKTGP